MRFDLEERTTEFAKKVIKFCQKLPRNPINNRLTGQCVGSSGSIGANYREAAENQQKRSKGNLPLAGAYTYSQSDI